ncbi:hypothetical protein CMQ_4134 [Grosmannia clavigera kw1407]|uniref:Uncharacterized protein n=1 Tax=Grosmannia clavigera (strain kw1407 / UAMH 11150) TaxID=655863 RepID=F0X8K8_GROCL|nr:uncharacterized protein CMQ_4134 [Grosmannia clavigera kw1407]EFX06065.1 hypothetical protein CMQ_4134 [Grosmannia clavigera kw1407]
MNECLRLAAPDRLDDDRMRPGCSLVDAQAQRCTPRPQWPLSARPKTPSPRLGNVTGTVCILAGDR